MNDDLSAELMKQVIMHSQYVSNRLYSNLIEHYKKDIEKLRINRNKTKNDFNSKEERKKETSSWTKNLSDYKLSDTEDRVLSLGFNFGVSSKRVSKAEICANVELGIRNLPDESSSIIRNKLSNILCKPISTKSNLNTEEMIALKKLTNNPDIAITKSDKGNSTVVMNTTDYDKKIMFLLNDDNTYMLLKKDITKNIERKLNKFVFDLFKQDKIPQSTYHYLHSTDATAPCLYGLPKIHKSNIPLRPIVSFINSPLYNLSKFLAGILSPLVGLNSCSVKNSYEFVEIISGITLSSNECLVSFDVVSLFTKIPVNTARYVVLNLLKMIKIWNYALVYLLKI